MRHEFSGEVQCSDALFCKEADTRARAGARTGQRAPLSAAAANGRIAPLLHLPHPPSCPPSCLRSSLYFLAPPCLSSHSLSLALSHPSRPPPLVPFVLHRYYQVMLSLSTTRLAALFSAGCLYIVLAHIYMNIHICIYIYYIHVQYARG